MTIYEPHPAAAIYPPCTEDELAALVESIATSGQQEPIVLCRVGDVEMILDGRSRQMALQQLEEAGTPILRQYTMYTGDDPLGYVLAKHTRRNLTKSQAACVALNIEERWRSDGRTAPGRMREDAARLAGVSRRMVDQAAKIAAQSEAVYEAVESGALTLGKAARDVGIRQSTTEWDEQPPTVEEMADWIRRLIEDRCAAMQREACHHGKDELEAAWQAVKVPLTALIWDETPELPKDDGDSEPDEKYRLPGTVNDANITHSCLECARFRDTLRLPPYTP